MLLSLTVTTGPDIGRVFEIETGELLLIGRGNGCEIQLHDPRASRVHCRIYAGRDRARILDANSRCGTVVNSRKISQQRLQSGDVITLGATELRLGVVSEATARTLAPDKRHVPMRLARKRHTAVKQAFLFPRPPKDQKPTSSSNRYRLAHRCRACESPKRPDKQKSRRVTSHSAAARAKVTGKTFERPKRQCCRAQPGEQPTKNTCDLSQYNGAVVATISTAVIAVGLTIWIISSSLRWGGRTEMARLAYTKRKLPRIRFQHKPLDVDQMVFNRLNQLGIQPADVCSDDVFVRRVYLDVIGTLPTAEEARQFLLDRDPDKRRILIDRLLERPEYADYWAMKWSDLLRVKAEFPIKLWPNAVQAYHRWIRTSIKENMPYDRFARELLTGSGSNFRDPQVNFYRAVQNKDSETIARAVALTFMGVRAENWPEDRLAGMAAFFSRIGYKKTAEWKEEIVFFDILGTAEDAGAGVSGPAIFPDGTPAQLSPDEDPREVFADWLIAPQNPWFARNIVNRIWYWLLGRGIIHEPDDIRPDNPPRNPELLAGLEKEFIAAGYDLKHIYRLILNSKTYQHSCRSRTDQPEAEANFAYYPLHRLDAEVLLDALCQISGTTEQYSSQIPEPFTFIPENQRAIALADGSITSPFLEMFGRPPRDTGLLSERNNKLTSAQELHLLNSSHIKRKIQRTLGSQAFYQSNGDPRQIAENLYLTVLSRFPTEEELKIFQSQTDSSQAHGPDALFDLTWALVNNAEFLYRH